MELIRFDLLAQGSAHFLLIAEFAVVDDRVGRAEESGFLRCVCVGVDRRGGGDDADQVTGWQYVRAPETYSQFSRADFHLDTDSYLSAAHSFSLYASSVIRCFLSSSRRCSVHYVFRLSPEYQSTSYSSLGHWQLGSAFWEVQG